MRSWLSRRQQVEPQLARAAVLDRALARAGVVDEMAEEQRDHEEERNAQHVAGLQQHAEVDEVRHGVQMRDRDQQRRTDHQADALGQAR